MSAKKTRLDNALVSFGLVRTRSQAENLIKLGMVTVGGKTISKPGYFVSEGADIQVTADEQYVSRAALKLASIADSFGLNFTNKVVLDVGSSTGGFTDYALKNGAQKVIAVDVGTDQLHPSLRDDSRVELREQTDIRDIKRLSDRVDIVVIDVSFISLKDILPHIAKLLDNEARIVAMLKPQFEATPSTKHKGVIKNEKIRRDILKGFEVWVKKLFVIENKADSQVSGSKGNIERFYLLKKLA